MLRIKYRFDLGQSDPFICDSGYKQVSCTNKFGFTNNLDF